MLDFHILEGYRQKYCSKDNMTQLSLGKKHTFSVVELQPESAVFVFLIHSSVQLYQRLSLYDILHIHIITKLEDHKDNNQHGMTDAFWRIFKYEIKQC